jgi:hypothetical protein
MDTTHNQEMKASITHTKESLQQVSSEIASTNSCNEKFETQVQQQFYTMDDKFMGEFSSLQSVVN